MRVLTRVLSLLLIFPIIVSCLALAETSGDVPVWEIADFKKLEALGIIDDDDEIAAGNYVTRAEFVKYAVRICGFCGENYALTSINPFADVNSSTEGYEEILTAYALGLINGTTASTFEPERHIEINEMAKILVIILGYADIAENTIGYSLGYVVKAMEMGIFDNVATEPDGRIDAKNLLKLLLNTLSTNVVQISRVINTTDEEVRYEAIAKQTLLSLVFDMHYGAGVIVSNEYTSIYGDNEVGKGAVLTDKGEVYHVGQTNAADLLGYYAEFYYKSEGTDQNVLHFISVAENKNTITVVKSDAIEAVSKTEFSYYQPETEKIVKLKISKTASLIYNGCQIDFSETYLRPETGDVTLIDNDGDGLVDVIRVMSYRTIWVAGVSAGTYTISDHFGGHSIVLDPEDNDYAIHIEKYGAEIAFNKISERDVISYAESVSGTKKMKYLRVCAKTAVGTVSTVGDDFVTIDGTDYPLSKSAAEMISVGITGTFYLDYTGCIVACEAGYDMVYGWLYAMNKQAFGAASAKLFTENSRWVILDLNERISLSNGMTNAQIKAEDFYNTYWSEDGSQRQLIRYSVNAQGKISAIDLALKVEAWSEEEQEAIKHDRFRLSRSLTSAQYRAPRYRFFNNIATLAADAKIFMLPVDADSFDDYYIGQPSNLSQNQVYYNVSIYDMNEVGVAPVCVIDKHIPTVPTNAMPMIVESVTACLHENGYDTTYTLKGMYKGGPVSIVAKNKDIIDQAGIKSGDIITFVLENGKISDISLAYDRDNGEYQRFLLNGLASSGAMLAGRIVDVSTIDNMIVVDYGGKEVALLSIFALSDVYLYDANSKRPLITRGGVGDVQKGASVFIKASGYGAQEIVIFQ